MTDEPKTLDERYRLQVYFPELDPNEIWDDGRLVFVVCRGSRQMFGTT